MKSGGGAEAVRSVTVLVTEELVDRFADGDTVVIQLDIGAWLCSLCSCFVGTGSAQMCIGTLSFQPPIWAFPTRLGWKPGRSLLLCVLLSEVTVTT